MATALSLTSDLADVQAFTGPGRLMGYSIGESAVVPAAASVVLRDGTSASGKILAVIALQASAFDWAWWFPTGIQFATGLYVDRTGGSTQGAVYIA